ncbi:MAG: hypothetical protein EOM24_14515 [Chloroflexia bacterium]|nr:hypothetical protein [Chloroflexia bacterium]
MMQPLVRFRSTSLLSIAVLFGLLLVGLALAWLAHDRPLAPQVAHGWLRADLVSALTLLLLASYGLVAVAVSQADHWRTAGVAWCYGMAALTGHLALIAALVIVGVALQPAAMAQRRLALASALATAGGLVLIAMTSGEWLYAAPGAGAGLAGGSLVLLLVGTVLASKAQLHLLFVMACYALLRTFSLGPWPLQWLFVALVAGAALALWASWHATVAPRALLPGWVELVMAAFVLVGTGLGAGAGVVVASYALLIGPLVLLARRPSFPLPNWPLLVLVWMAVAAAVAGRLTILAILLGVSGFLLALALARWTPPLLRSAHVGRAGEALALVVAAGAPLFVGTLAGPLVAQLQAGLSPYGELVASPWTGLLVVYNAEKEYVASLPVYVLIALGMVLAAAGWLILRVIGMNRSTDKLKAPDQ